MKIAEINMVDYGSTGNLMLAISDEAQKRGFEIRTFSMRWKNQTVCRENHTYFGTYIENGAHQVFQKITGRGGRFSYFGTLSLIKKLKEFGPDIVHLHNLHNSYLNLELLFKYLKNHKIKTVWTLHDCWAFTGKCPHFVMHDCDKWKTKCGNCPALSEYPASKFDATASMWSLKKKLYGDFEELTIVTPSYWLHGLVKESFLNKRKTEVIHNGIDLNVFKPRKGEFREKNGLEGKKIILGVSFGWSEKKGIDIFIKLAQELPDEYKIVLVGVDENVKKILPENILAISRTSSKEVLADIYSAADVFVNPTREENFPTVNIEAIACGTPVVTFDTGGCAEIIDSFSGIAVSGYDDMRYNIISVCNNKPFSQKDCISRAHTLSKEICIDRYVELYEKLAE